MNIYPQNCTNPQNSKTKDSQDDQVNKIEIEISKKESIINIEKINLNALKEKLT